MFSALRLADRWVTATELLALDLGGATVVLSACESARSRAAAGDELLGFARAVLGAGAASLVASLWRSDDEATHALMTTFHTLRPRLGPSAALRAAQLEVMRHTPHPYRWAAFAALGKG
jgi:CHAT domain-containing protein